MRSPLYLLALAPLLVGCGAVGAVAGAVQSLAEASLKSDMDNQPHRVCGFDAPATDVLDAMVGALEEKGFTIAEVERADLGVRAEPSSSEKGPDVGGRDSWRLEIMEGFVYELDGQQVAYMAFQKGLSRSPDNWDYDMGGEFNDADNDRRIEDDDVEPDYSRERYEGLMDLIADRLDEPRCGS